MAVTKTKKTKVSGKEETRGTVMAAQIRASANKLTDLEREALMADAMRLIYGVEQDVARAHRR